MIEIGNYIHKPRSVYACQFTGDNTSELSLFCGSCFQNKNGSWMLYQSDNDIWEEINPGNFIVRPIDSFNAIVASPELFFYISQEDCFREKYKPAHGQPWHGLPAKYDHVLNYVCAFKFTWENAEYAQKFVEANSKAGNRLYQHDSRWKITRPNLMTPRYLHYGDMIVYDGQGFWNMGVINFMDSYERVQDLIHLAWK